MKIRRRRFAEMEVVNRGKVRPEPGKCNHPNAEGTKFCRSNAGQGTAHPGTGYCVKHDTKAYDPIHRYRGLKNQRVRDRMVSLDAQERDIFDLIPEIQLLRSLLLDYVDRFYEFQEELHAWYVSEKRRPKTALDITEVSGMIEAITRMIERKHRIEAKEAISLETFRRVSEAMGIIVAKHVRDGRVLEAIETEWSSLSLDAKATQGVPMPAPTEMRQLTDGADSDAGDD